MTYYVAKTYTEWPRETEPYEIGGRMYVKVRSPKGIVKQVRAYTEHEYQKMYPAQSLVTPSVEPILSLNVKNILGFQKEYIWIFKGDLESAEYWFSATPECRYHVFWGWYIVSTDEIPSNIPSCITPVQLPWEKVGNSDGTLLNQTAITQVIEELIFEKHPSTFQGAIGERIERSVKFVNLVELGETQFGTNRLFLFEDEKENQYSWITGTNKTWSIGDSLKIRGTVKEHETYKGIKRTALTRVMEVK